MKDLQKNTKSAQKANGRVDTQVSSKPIARANTNLKYKIMLVEPSQYSVNELFQQMIHLKKGHI